MDCKNLFGVINKPLKVDQRLNKYRSHHSRNAVIDGKDYIKKKCLSSKWCEVSNKEPCFIKAKTHGKSSNDSLLN